MRMSIITERPVSLSSLLPYDIGMARRKEGRSTLLQYKFLLMMAEGAVEALEAGNYKEFDALVGENMCHIRAVKIAWIAGSLLETSNELKEWIVLAKEQIDDLLDKTRLKATFSLQSIFKEGGVKEVLLTENETFIIKTYILTRIRKITSRPLLQHEVTVTRNLCQFGLSRTFAANLIDKLRRDLSLDSVEFLLSSVENLPKSKEFEPYAKERLLVQKNQCITLPFFFATDVAMSIAKNVLQVPLVIHVDLLAEDQGNRVVRNLSLFFTPLSGKYEKTELAKLDPKALALIFEGVMRRPFAELPSEEGAVEELLQHDVVRLILLCAAAHEKFLDPAKIEQLRLYQEEALRLGCSLENPALFFVNHVFSAHPY